MLPDNIDHSHTYTKIDSTTPLLDPTSKSGKRPEVTLYVNGAEVAAYLKMSWQEHVTNFVSSIFGYKKIIKFSDQQPSVDVAKHVYLKVSDIAKALGLTPGYVRRHEKELDIDVLSGISQVASRVLKSSGGVPTSPNTIEAEVIPLDREEGVLSSTSIQKIAEGVTQAADTVMKPKMESEQVERNFMWELNALVPAIHLGEGLNSKEKINLLTLGRSVGFKNVLHLLTAFSYEPRIKEPHSRMLNTLIVAGEELSKRNSQSGPFNPRQYPRIKDQTFSFIIDYRNKIYVTTDYLAEGSYKKVSRAIELSTLQEYVRPVVRRNFVKTEEEIELTRTLYENVSHIVSPYEFSFLAADKRKNDKLVMLHVKYDGDGTRIPQANFRQGIKALSDCAKGLAGMHDFGWVHMDFKPANFLIQGDPTSTKLIEAKLSDFGGAVKTGNPVRQFDVLYRPPEAVKVISPPATSKWDSFALGVSLFEIVFLNSPLLSKPLKDLHSRYAGGFGGASPEILELELEKLRITGPGLTIEQNLKNDALDLMKELLKGDPAQRISCEQAAVEFDKILQLMEL